MLKLVKDFEDFQVIYYWLDETNQKVSPDLPTLTHAEDWLAIQQAEGYKGRDRRRRIVDRRRNQRPPEQQRNGKRSAKPLGRRKTDKQIQIDIDYSEEKIKQLRQSLAS